METTLSYNFKLKTSFACGHPGPPGRELPGPASPRRAVRRAGQSLSGPDRDGDVIICNYREAGRGEPGPGHDSHAALLPRQFLEMSDAVASRRQDDDSEPSPPGQFHSRTVGDHEGCWISVRSFRAGGART